MLLRFETEDALKQYFNEEANTIHKTDTNQLYRLSGGIPKDYPAILQSGPAFLTNDVVFRNVNIQKDFYDEYLISEAKERQKKQEKEDNRYSMSIC